MWAAHEGMGWWMLFGSVFWLLFIAIGAYLLTAGFQRDTRTRDGKSESPLDIAKRRYAAGEISEEEYERLRDNLMR